MLRSSNPFRSFFWGGGLHIECVFREYGWEDFEGWLLRWVGPSGISWADINGGDMGLTYLHLQ